MNIFQSIILGIVQGLTEFLPISSSGHLVLFERFIGIPSTNLTFEIILHLATLIAVIIYFRKDLLHLTVKEFFLLGIGTVPAVFVGLFFKDYIEQAFNSLTHIAIEFAVTGLILLWAQTLLSPKKEAKTTTEITKKNALIIGIWQAFAILPAISRSGSTVAGSLLLGVERERAFRFSFLLSIPAILGASILTLKDFFTGEEIFDQQLLIPYLIGAIFSFVFGLLSLAWFHQIIKKAQLWYFGVYCLLLSAGLFFYLLFLQK